MDVRLEAIWAIHIEELQPAINLWLAQRCERELANAENRPPKQIGSYDEVYQLFEKLLTDHGIEYVTEVHGDYIFHRKLVPLFREKQNGL